MDKLIETSLDSAQSSKFSSSTPDKTVTSANSKESAQANKKRFRASSDDIESALFLGHEDPTTTTHEATRPTKRVRLIAGKHNQGGWAAASEPSRDRPI